MSATPSVIGRYEVVERLAQGGMGSLYLARDPKIERLVVIKLLRDEWEGPELRERFASEARSIGRLHHSNIVTIFDVGEHDGQPFIAMEYIRGETLAELVKREAPVPLHRKLDWMDALLAGLEYAHRAGIVHRDIKPANIMIDQDGILKILDFGIARLDDSGMTRTGSMMGTPNYMPPEQITGRAVDARADQFSVGAVFYELVTYKRAFAGETFSVMQRILLEAPEGLSRLATDVDEGVAQIVSRLLEKEPENRFPDLTAARRELKSVRLRLSESEEPGTVILPSASQAPTVFPTPTPHPAAALDIVRRVQPERADEEAASAMPLAGAADSQELSERQNPPRTIPATVTSLNPELMDLPTLIAPQSIAQHPEPGEKSRDELRNSPLRSIESRDLEDELDKTRVLPASEPDKQTSDLSDIKLVVIDSANPRAIGRTFSPGGRSVIVGREGDWLPVADAGWSRQHVVISCTASGFVIRDLNSVNGTRVNGRPVPPASEQPLLFGSRIAIGSTVFTFSYAHDTTLPDLTGAEVDGRYILETRLRDGAKAVLYAARDKRLPGRVALKLLSPELAKYPEYLESFRREAELARQLHHPHICRVLDFGHSGVRRAGFRGITTHFLCSELMEGGNLADRLEHKEPLPTKQVAEWIGQVSGALAYAHRNGLVHGDLKPAAIVFDDDDHPYITDFAVAQQTNQDRQYVVGTPAFMAPELWQAEAPSPAVDQFALAALSYYMITGSRPFEGQDHPEIRRRNFAQGPLPAHQEAEHHGRPGVLRGVSSVLAMGLATRPEERYPSISDFAAALSAALVRPARSADAAQLFFSYQRESMAGWVNYFSDRVRAGGLSVFVDTHNRDGSGVFPDQLARAIEDCRVFVCFVGDKTLESRWVRDEIGLAYQYGKPMVPVFQENYVKPPDEALTPGITRLLSSQGVHLQDRRNLSPERSVADLVALVQRNIERDSSFN